jgi:hypothetical protein
MVLLWHFRVPVSGLPMETRMSHVRASREIGRAAFGPEATSCQKSGTQAAHSRGGIQAQLGS